jgi:hypothetical protein
LARGWWVLALNLEKHFDALKGGCDEGHGNGGKETSGGDLADCVLRGVVLHFDFGNTADEGFAEIVALSCVSWYLDHIHRITYPEANGDCRNVS